MSNLSDLEGLTEQIQRHGINENGVSFCGQSLKLNTINDAKIVVDQIKKCENLKFLNLDGNTVGMEAAKTIAEELKHHAEFTHAIWKNMFTGRTKEEIPDALRYLGNGIILAKAKLVSLDLSDNAFGPIGVQGLATLLKSECCFSLRVLILNNNGLGIGGGKMLAETLLECYRASDWKFSLQTFIAGRNRLENKGAKALAAFFKQIGSLQTISMPQNGIYHDGISALCIAFKSNPHLKSINLNDNTMTVKGAYALANALRYLPNLQTLNIGDCLLKTKGAQIIAYSISGGHAQLQELIMDGNEIKISGGLALVKALKDKKNFKTLNLNSNLFGESGIKSMAKEMKKCHLNQNALTLSDDELEDDDDTYDDDESNVDTKDEESGEDSEEEESDEELSSEGEEGIPVAAFISSPTAENFTGLGSKRSDRLIRFIETCGSDNYLSVAIPLLVNVSNLCDNESVLKEEATELALKIYKQMYDWAKINNWISLLTNALCVQLRLIKNEADGSLVECNEAVCVKVLEQSFTKDVMPESAQTMFRFLIDRKEEQTLNR